MQSHQFGKTLMPLHLNAENDKKSLTPAHQTPDMLALELVSTIQDTSMNIEEVQLVVAAGIQKIFRANAVCLHLLDAEEPGFYRQKGMLDHQGWSLQRRVPINKGTTFDNAHDISIKTVNILAQEQYDWLPMSKNTALTVVCLPLVVNTQIIGGIEVIFTSNRRLSSGDTRALKAISSTLSNAMRTRTLFAQSNAVLKEMEISRSEILKSRNTLRTVFDSVPVSIYIVNNEYKVILVNKSRSDRAGIHPSMIVGKHCYEAFYQRSAPCLGCKIMESFSKSDPTSRQVCDEQNREWRMISLPIGENEASAPDRAIILEEDITERQQLVANLLHSEKLATIGELAAGVAHEINNPLAAIIANAQLLERSLGEDSSDNREMLSLISTASDRASRVIRSLLDISRPYQKQEEPLDLNATIFSIVSLLQYKFRNNCVNLRLDLDQNMPPITVQKDHVEGIIINLIINAIDAIENPDPEIRIVTAYREGAFHIQVDDNGRGISPEDMTRIFKPFFTTKEVGKGTGLGLSICQKTVAEYGGTIDVISTLGQGTSFHVTLPDQR
jgi:two-component system, NtrC family, sensor kinase